MAGKFTPKCRRLSRTAWEFESEGRLKEQPIAEVARTM